MKRQSPSIFSRHDDDTREGLETWRFHRPTADILGLVQVFGPECGWNHDMLVVSWWACSRDVSQIRSVAVYFMTWYRPSPHSHSAHLGIRSSQLPEFLWFAPSWAVGCWAFSLWELRTTFWWPPKMALGELLRRGDWRSPWNKHMINFGASW